MNRPYSLYEKYPSAPPFFKDRRKSTQGDPKGFQKTKENIIQGKPRVN
jgi:hypothetical protein